MADDFRGSKRFRSLRRVGEGGMGQVYAVHDVERDETVALKTIVSPSPARIYRLKKEFRALVDVAHPNLVALYDLMAHEDQWFFTMELVDGVDFIDFVRPNGLDISRLRSVVYQVVQGVLAIHNAGVLHRDLKPSNVLVTPDGQVKILDFGISVDIAQVESPFRSVEEGLIGTVAYMAPEQADGKATPTSDWYALGVMLYKALTGELPFAGHPLQVLMRKHEEDPRRPDELEPDLPRDLVDLCVDLIRRDPNRRPTGQEILKRLGSRDSVIPASPEPAPLSNTPLVGRASHLRELHEAFGMVRDGRTVAVYVHGPSGLGKTTLVNGFLEQLIGEETAVVLSGRCYARELIPYKSLDGVIDSLSRYLRTLTHSDLDNLLTQDLSTLARLFPALARVERIRYISEPGQQIKDPVQLRRKGFAALRELLRRICAVRPVAIWIDDLQWGDADSIVLLEDLLSPPDPPTILLIVSFRSEEIESHDFLGKLLIQAQAGRGREIRVGSLTEAETRGLTHQLLGPEDSGDAEIVEAIVAESAGSPFLIEQLVRYVNVFREGVGTATSRANLAGMLDARIAQLPDHARAFLETLAVAGRPMQSVVVRDVVGLEGDERPLVVLLKAEHFLRASGSADHLELYHDRIRETIAGRIGRERAAAIHLRLVATMEAHGISDPGILHDHYLEAGQRERAGSYAVRAGDNAANVLAFGRATAFYRRALELAPSGSRELGELRVKLGDALASAGHGPEAARVYLAAADEVSDLEALDLRRRAAEQLLRSGHVDQGVAVLRTVLKAVGLRLARSPRHALLRLLARRALVRLRGLRFTEREADKIDPKELSRIDVCWTVGIGLGRIDNIRAADFQSLQLLLALKAGEPGRIARALATEGVFVSLAGGKAKKRARRLAKAAREIAERIDEPEALGFAALSPGVSNFLLGEFATARDHCESAERIFRERCTGVAWEIITAESFACQALLYLGELAELANRVPMRLREAREHGDLYAVADAASRHNVTWLMADDVSGAREALREAVGPWSFQGFHMQHYWSLFAESQIDLYTGDGMTAWDRSNALWPNLGRSKLLRIQLVRVEARHLRARCALAVAAADRDARQECLRNAERDARRIAKEGMAWSDPLADLLLAGVLAARSDSSEASRMADRAVKGFEAADMAAYAAAARRRYGQLKGGERGDFLVIQADSWMRSEGIVNPERFTSMLAPGFQPG